VTVERGRSVSVAFEDGYLATFTLADLRAACPCAGCRNARDQGRPAFPGRPETLTVIGAEMIGAWAIQFRWMDGHQAGIFPWERLRVWAESGVFTLPADSGLPAAGGPDPVPATAVEPDDAASFN
jgi:DUF971 family protein